MTDPEPPSLHSPAPSLTPEEQDRQNLLAWEKQDASEQARNLQGVFANRIYVQPDGTHLRVSFGERIGEESRFHSTIVVPNGDALEFGKLLVSMASAGIERELDFYRQYLPKIDAAAASEGNGGDS